MDDLDTFVDKGLQGIKRLEKQLDALGEAIESKFQTLIGTTQAGWAPLADSTLETRHKQGYTDDSEELLRSGIYRGSFTHEKEVKEDEFELTVGIKFGTIRLLEYDHRPHDIGALAVSHERGTATEPPRPMLTLVADALTEQLRDALGEDVDFRVEKLYAGE